MIMNEKILTDTVEELLTGDKGCLQWMKALRPAIKDLHH